MFLTSGQTVSLSSFCPRSPAGLESAVRSDKRGLKVLQELLLILRVSDTTVKHGRNMWNVSAQKKQGSSVTGRVLCDHPIQNTHTHFHHLFVASRYPKSHQHHQDTLGQTCERESQCDSRDRSKRLIMRHEAHIVPPRYSESLFRDLVLVFFIHRCKFERDPVSELASHERYSRSESASNLCRVQFHGLHSLRDLLSTMSLLVLVVVSWCTSVDIPRSQRDTDRFQQSSGAACTLQFLSWVQGI